MSGPVQKEAIYYELAFGVVQQFLYVTTNHVFSMRRERLLLCFSIDDVPFWRFRPGKSTNIMSLLMDQRSEHSENHRQRIILDLATARPITT